MFSSSRSPPPPTTTLMQKSLPLTTSALLLGQIFLTNHFTLKTVLQSDLPFPFKISHCMHICSTFWLPALQVYLYHTRWRMTKLRFYTHHLRNEDFHTLLSMPSSSQPLVDCQPSLWVFLGSWKTSWWSALWSRLVFSGLFGAQLQYADFCDEIISKMVI